MTSSFPIAILSNQQVPTLKTAKAKTNQQKIPLTINIFQDTPYKAFARGFFIVGRATIFPHVVFAYHYIGVS